MMLKAVCFLACSFTPNPSALGLARQAVTPRFPVHVTPIKADKNEEKTMTIINIALLINALAKLIAALAEFITANRHRR